MDILKQIDTYIKTEQPGVLSGSAFLQGETDALNDTDERRAWYKDYYRGYVARCEMEKLMNEVKGNE